MSNPYINTYLTTNVRLLPKYMDNNIRKHIKASVIEEHKGRCFNEYGLITNIHEIEILNDAEIIKEDLMCCPMFYVKFLCTLCRPLTGQYIVATVQGATEQIITTIAGPMIIVINNTSINVNKSVFIYNTKFNAWTEKKGEGDATETEGPKKLRVIKPGTQVLVRISSKQITDHSQRIFCMGYLDRIATEEDVKKNLDFIKNINMYESVDSYSKVIQEMKKNTEDTESVYSESEITETEEDDDN